MATFSLTADQPPPADDLTTIADFAAPPPPALSVDLAGRLRRTGDLTAALSAVARSGLELYGEPEPTPGPLVRRRDLHQAVPWTGPGDTAAAGAG